MNHSLQYQQLSNRYFVMRHGLSLANEQGIIVSHPQNGCDRYGLSEPGRLQVKHSFLAENRLDANTKIVSSDFKRARESANIAHEMLNCNAPIYFDQRLRERNFGELELSADDAYAQVWREDAIDPDSRPGDAESVNQVMMRVTAAVADYETRYSDVTLLLISHGDALQILQTAFARQDGSTHRQLEHLNTAEIRQLILSRV